MQAQLLHFPAFAALDYGKQTLIGADFSNTDLKGATFYLSDLQDADFSGSDLQGASFFDAKLRPPASLLVLTRARKSASRAA